MSNCAGSFLPGDVWGSIFTRQIYRIRVFHSLVYKAREFFSPIAWLAWRVFLLTASTASEHFFLRVGVFLLAASMCGGVFFLAATYPAVPVVGCAVLFLHDAQSASVCTPSNWHPVRRQHHSTTHNFHPALGVKWRGRALRLCNGSRSNGRWRNLLPLERQSFDRPCMNAHRTHYSTKATIRNKQTWHVTGMRKLS